MAREVGRPIQEIFVSNENGSQFVKIHFEVIQANPITADQWYEVNHRIEDLLESVINNSRPVTEGLKMKQNTY